MSDKAMSEVRRDFLSRLQDCTAEELGVALTMVHEYRLLCRYGGHGEATLVLKHGRMVELIHKHTRRLGNQTAGHKEAGRDD